MSPEQSHIDPYLESEYNVRARRGDFDEVVADWMRRSAAQRNDTNCCLDLAYGSGDRERMDVFTANVPDAPTLIYIHGGYWQRQEKSIYSFLAEPFVNSGANVVIPNYDLCPTSTIPEITDQIQQAIIWLWRNAASLGVSRDHINISGHSAGGHLTAMMLATDWPVLGDDIPADLIKSAIILTGIYELEPLRKTTINDAVGIDEWTAADYSPLYLSPTSSAPLLVSLGGAETSQFHQQSRNFVAEWAQYDMEMAQHIEPGVDHFDVVNRLADPESELFKRARSWLR
jgi:arylformamidase